MRMWMLDPKKMCRQHLLGEHYEIHKAVGNLRHSGTWANSLTEKGFLEPQNFKNRHDQLVCEMKRRGMKHESPLNICSIKICNGCVDTKVSINDLISRCNRCRINFQEVQE